MQGRAESWGLKFCHNIKDVPQLQGYLHCLLSPMEFTLTLVFYISYKEFNNGPLTKWRFYIKLKQNFNLANLIGTKPLLVFSLLVEDVQNDPYNAIYITELTYKLLCFLT